MSLAGDMPQSTGKPSQAVFQMERYPISETAAGLRSLGLYLLECHLEGHQPHPQELVSRLALYNKVWSPLDLKNLEVAPQDLKTRVGDGLFQLRQRLYQPKKAAAYQKAVTSTMEGSLSRSGFKKALHRGLNHRFEEAQHYQLTLTLWKTAAHLAFTEPNFQLQVSRRILSYLRNRVILDQQETSSPIISPPCFWFLLSLYQPPKQKWWAWLHPKTCLSHLKLRRLQSLAQDMATTESWANHWDQWLLLHILRPKPHALKQLKPSLGKALVNLPLLRDFGPSLPKLADSDKTQHLQLASSPNGAPPPWLHQLYPPISAEVTSGV